MKYNINRNLHPVILLLCSLTSCAKYLNQTPQTSLADGNFWTTTTDLQLACNALYASVPGQGTQEDDNQSDIGWGGSPNTTSDGSRTTPSTDATWNNEYTLIRTANNILEKSATVSGDSATINQYLGEARFFRALGYYQLVRRYGDVPYIDRSIGLNGDTLLYASRTDREVVIDSIYADLNFAAANCPQPDAQPAASYGRITATAALAFESRVALFEGTWDEFHGGGDANTHLQTALNAAKSVINGGKHTLYTGQGDSSYFYEFVYAGGLAGNPLTSGDGPQTNYTYATNKENILVSLYGVSIADNIRSNTFTRTITGGNVVINGTRAVADMYLFSDGLPEGKSVYDSTYMATSTLTEFRNRDPRMGMTFANKTEPYVNNGSSGIQLFQPMTSYAIRKFCVLSDWLNATGFVNYNAIRYAEVLLNYAEATYELNGSISDADLNLTINALRNRATNNNPTILPLLTNAFVAANGLNMRTEIRRERSIELAMEGFRYWDVLRWKTAETVLPLDMLGPEFFAAESPQIATAPPENANGFSILEPASKRTFNPMRDYLFPLPTQQILLEENLTQNPGW